MKETLDTIKECIYKNPGAGRREIMEKTDFDIRTVTAGVQKLIRQGFVSAKPDETKKVGRTGMLYYPAGENNLNFYGIYLGLYEITGIVKDAKGKILDIHHEPFSLDWASLNHTARKIAKIIDTYKLKSSSPVSSIGLTIQERRGNDFANGVKQLLSLLTGLPVHCGTPIDAFAWSLKMKKPGIKKIVMVHFGTTKIEISFINGTSLEIEGAKFARELSHTTVEKNGPPCYCGKNGCLEYYVHGYAMEEEYRDIRNINPSQNIDLAGDYAAGDNVAAEIVERAEKYIADALVKISKNFKPDLLCLLVLEYDRVIKNMKKLMNRKINLTAPFEVYTVMEKAGEACAAATADKTILINCKNVSKKY